jgi:hypothetical protein
MTLIPLRPENDHYILLSGLHSEYGLSSFFTEQLLQITQNLENHLEYLARLTRSVRERITPENGPEAYTESDEMAVKFHLLTAAATCVHQISTQQEYVEVNQHKDTAWCNTEHGAKATYVQLVFHLKITNYEQLPKQTTAVIQKKSMELH